MLFLLLRLLLLHIAAAALMVLSSPKSPEQEHSGCQECKRSESERRFLPFPASGRDQRESAVVVVVSAPAAGFRRRIRRGNRGVMEAK